MFGLFLGCVGWCVGGVRYDTVCAQSCSVAVDMPDNTTLLRFRVLKMTTMSTPPPTASQRDAVLHCSPLSTARTAQTGRLSDSSKLRQGQKAQGTNLESWRTTDASTQESSNNPTSVHELVLACSPPPSPRPSLRVESSRFWHTVRKGCVCRWCQSTLVEQSCFSYKCSKICRPLGAGV